MTAPAYAYLTAAVDRTRLGLVVIDNPDYPVIVADLITALGAAHLARLVDTDPGTVYAWRLGKHAPQPRRAQLLDYYYAHLTGHVAYDEPALDDEVA